MTITLYLNKLTLLRDLQTLHQIFDAEYPELVEPLSNFLQPLDIATVQHNVNYVAIQVTVEEFTLIGIFNKGI